ncbi:chemotaxis protein CheA [Aestuariibacter sp. AA17]|uniref:Chemotaxis protein CheA n=1 Tax=Fluctibacter corallii TaxID=2984329 RepID=A0ABT3A8Y4_9ALTE|nr:chemotaxis protein CheA [Aestuariibacter sp. AA17]MCV2884737.1 chemotaxis protein CheA [Aestuariibacter sp. AA17]
MGKIQDTYKEEAEELLTDLEDAFLELENDPRSEELINRIFRAMHTIKGSGAMAGFDNIAAFTHEFETAFDRVRKGELSVTQELIEIGLASQSWIAEMLDSNDQQTALLKEQADELTVRLLQLMPDSAEKPNTEQGKQMAPEVAAEEHDEQIFRIRFKPNEDFFNFGSKPLALLRCLEEMGEYNVVAYTDALPSLESLHPLTSYLSWDVLLKTQKSRDDILDVFIFDEDDCELHVDVIDHGDEQEDDYKRIGEILVERGDISADELENLLPKAPKVGEILEAAGAVAKEKITSALVEQEVVKTDRQQKQKAVENIRVPAPKLEMQMNLVGELVIALASLNRIAASHADTQLINACEEMNHLITELRDNVLSIRMMQIGSTFSRFRRVVRDLAKDQGKNIELFTHGAETELDKTVIDQLGDPLVHLIRNSIDHGIEPPEERAEKGKPAEGKIILSAQHTQGQVVIKIEDNGRGIDPTKIRSKAIDKGVIEPDADISDKDALQLIFAPGFSTAEKITNISGRGVGMDVVKRTIEDLRGTIELDSIVNKGTTITLKLPLTLAIIEGLLTRVGDDVIAIPLSIIKECVEIRSKDLSKTKQGYSTKIRGTLMPCVSLREWAEISADKPDLVELIIVSVDNESFAFIVDEIIDQQQIVIKNLGAVYRSIDSISGATILGDGSVALIIDAFQILKRHLKSSGGDAAQNVA